MNFEKFIKSKIRFFLQKQLLYLYFIIYSAQFMNHPTAVPIPAKIKKHEFGLCF
jgi:hypothetical protein